MDKKEKEQELRRLKLILAALLYKNKSTNR